MAKKTKGGRREDEVLKAVMASPLVNERLRHIYALIYQLGSMTGAELDRELGNNNAHARLKDLAKLGLIRKNGHRRCSVTGKIVTAWAPTGHGPDGKIPPRERNTIIPSPRELSDFLKDMTLLRMAANAQGARIPPEFKKVMAWLQMGAPCRHTETKKPVRTKRG